MREHYKAALCVGIFALIGTPHLALAQDIDQKPLFIPSVYALDNAWNAQDHDFTQPAVAEIVLNTSDQEDIAQSYSDEIEAELNTPKATFKSDDDDEELDDKILKHLPFKNTLKYTWNVIDGEKDIYFEGLRVDRGNKGLQYKTQNIPFVGKVDALNLKAEMGEDSKLIFESDYIPLVGRVDGFNFKASAGSDSNISVRYKTDISW